MNIVLTRKRKLTATRKALEQTEMQDHLATT